LGTERALIEVFDRGEKNYCLAIEPGKLVGAVHDHLKQYPEEVAVRPAEVVGDLSVELLNGKTLEQVIGQVGILRIIQ
jgi:hypothetical protein